MERPTVYRIRVRGQLSPQWSSWFEGLEVHVLAEETELVGPLKDQAALHGVLARMRDLGLELLSIDTVATALAPAIEPAVPSRDASVPNDRRS
jgi:hypothetical protein